MTGEKIKRITIAADFPKYPVGRFPQNGAYNGTTFRDEVLAIALRDLSIDVVEVVFDGVAGFGSSFSEEAFGGLIRELGMKKPDLGACALGLLATTCSCSLNDYVTTTYGV